jgi:hypothetical protein
MYAQEHLHRGRSCTGHLVASFLYQAAGTRSGGRQCCHSGNTGVDACFGENPVSHIAVTMLCSSLLSREQSVISVKLMKSTIQ